MFGYAEATPIDIRKTAVRATSHATSTQPPRHRGPPARGPRAAGARPRAVRPSEADNRRVLTVLRYLDPDREEGFADPGSSWPDRG